MDFQKLNVQVYNITIGCLSLTVKSTYVTACLGLFYFLLVMYKKYYIYGTITINISCVLVGKVSRKSDSFYVYRRFSEVKVKRT